MALKGVKVIELAGLAPAPVCGMILKDFGAEVINVTKIESAFESLLPPFANLGKKILKLNLNNVEGVNILRRLCKTSDVLIDPYRKGVLEKKGLGPDVLTKENPKLIYARLTGYGQAGPYSQMAGHDINYLALSGILSLLGRKNENPLPPLNLLADFAGGSLTCAFGIVAALFERSQSGLGQVLDSNMVEGGAYLASWLFAVKDTFFLNSPRGENLFDGGAYFYDTYKTKDGKYVAVGALEPHFYEQLLNGLNLKIDDVPQEPNNQESRKIFQKVFLTKTREDWISIFENTDACVAPVLDLHEVHKHPHNAYRQSFKKDENGKIYPLPAPKMSRTPAEKCKLKTPGDDTIELLKTLNYSQEEIENFIKNKVIPSIKSNL